MYLDQKAAELQQKSIAIKIFFQLAHCCLYCFEKCVRFLSYSTYILIAIEGGGFCQVHVPPQHQQSPSAAAWRQHLHHHHHHHHHQCCC